MEFALPEIGEGVYEAELVSWLVKPGDAVRRGQGLLEVMTDKATMEVPAPFIGAIDELRVQAGQKVKVGDVVLAYTAAGTAAPEPAAAVAAPVLAATREVTPRNGHGAAPARLPVTAAPSVRLMARKLGINLDEVRGTGPDGRVLVEDLSSHFPTTAEKPPVPRHAGHDYGVAGTRVKLAGLRRAVAEHMAFAKRTIPHYSYIEECDVTELVRLRGQVRDRFADAGVKLTYLPFFIKAVVAALREVPIVNSSLDETAGEIVFHDRYDIGIAVAAPAGLLVPVIRNADKKDVAALAAEIERLSRDARAGRSRREDLRGGTFTVTSVGSLGGLISTPVINHPEVGILGIGKLVRRPVYDDHGDIRPADLIYLSLSFDHRVVDGAVGAAFTNVILRQLRNPATLLLPDRF